MGFSQAEEFSARLVTFFFQLEKRKYLPMERARRTVVAPLMTEGGTEAGPPII
jgi:hypothetical protein